MTEKKISISLRKNVFNKLEKEAEGKGLSRSEVIERVLRDRYGNKKWMLGFLGFLSFQGFRYFQDGNWLHLIWFVWVVWFFWFFKKD